MKRKRTILPKVDERFYEDVRESAELGLDEAQIAAWLRCDEETWRKLVKKHPRLLTEMRYGASAGTRRNAKMLREQAEKGSVSALALYLKTRSSWQEVERSAAPTVSITNNTGENVQLVMSDAAEAQRIYEKMVKAR